MGKYNTRHANKRIQRSVNVSKENLPNAADPDDEISTSTETNKKRKISKTSLEYEREAKRNKKTNNTHDGYCWKCHKIDAEIECSTCPRAFHPSCEKYAKINEDGSCCVCQQESIAKVTSYLDDEIHLSKLLLHIIDTACPMDREEYKPLVDWPDSEENEKLICKKDFRLIHDRCIQKDIQYESHVELVDDVKWIHHNCIIIYGEKSQIAKSAKKVLEVITLELNDALDCPECYCKKIGNEPLTFLNICKRPHPLVWAKVKFYPYWPAKCLRVLNGKAHVRFFRTHQMAAVPLSSVLALSEEYPSNSTKKPDKKSKISLDFLMASNELKAYVGIFEDHYGPFPYFQGHYGPFPYEDINMPFDFEKEEEIMKELLENHSRRRIVSEDLLISSSSDNEKESRPALVDLTGDESEEDGEQLHEEVASPIHENQNLFEDQIIVAPAIDAEEDYLENTDKSAPETSIPMDNDQSIIDTINNDTIIRNENMESIQQAISGSILPSHHSDDHQNLNWLSQRIPSPTGISISNVISGTDVPSDTGTELLVQVTQCEEEPTMQNNFVMSMPSAETNPFQSTSIFSQNSISSSNSMQLCLRNYDRTSESAGFSPDPPNMYPDDDAEIEIIGELSSSNVKTKINKIDTDCILQTILRHDPKSCQTLKQANLLVQQLFIQFWGSSTKLKNPEKIVQSQEHEIRTLKLQLEEMRKQISLMKDNYEERIQNADKILRSLKAELNKQGEELRKQKKKEEELRKQNQKWEADFEAKEKQCEERVREAKTIKFCNNSNCSKVATKLCCYSGVNTYAYCSENCKDTDEFHKRRCRSKPKEREAPGQVAIAREVVQQSTTVIYSTVETRSVQSHIANKEKSSSSAPQQASSANLKTDKVIPAKKTLEVARNCNRNQNSSDIY